MLRLALVVGLVFAFSAGAADARRDDHGGAKDDIRVTGICSAGVAAGLRVRTHDDGIEVRFQLRQTRGRGLWRITIVHENRVATRATLRTTKGEDTVDVRRTLADLPGSDNIVVHAWGPAGIGCRATATLPGT